MTRHEIYLFILENIGYNFKAKAWNTDRFYRAAKRADMYHTGI